MKREFVITLQDHKFLGWIASAYIIIKKDGHGFYEPEVRISTLNYHKYDNELSDHQKEIIKLIEEYSDHTLHKFFSKKKGINAKTFMEKLNPDYATNHIRPYIEKRMVKILDLTGEAGIDLYFRGNQKFINTSDQIIVNPGFSETVLNITKGENETTYFLGIRFQNKEINLLAKAGHFVTDNPCRLILENQLFYFEDINSKKLVPFFTKEYIQVPKSSEIKWYETFALNNIKKYPVKPNGFEIIEKEIKPSVILALQNDLSGIPRLNLTFQYDQKNYEFNKAPFIHVEFKNENDHFSFTKTKRDLAFEKSIYDYLKNTGLKSSSSDSLLTPKYADNDELNDIYHLIYWLQDNKSILEQKNIQLQQEKLDSCYNTIKPSLNIGITEDKDWFDMNITVKVGEFNIPFIRFKKNILSHVYEYILPNGEIFILPNEWFSKYEDVFTYGRKEGSKLRLSKHHFEFLSSALTGIEKQTQKFDPLKSPETNLIQLPDSIKATLRNYQQQGFTWFKLLQQNNFGGCLADDMGLGKTIQTLALLLNLKEQEPTTRQIKKVKKGVEQLDLFSSHEDVIESKMSPVSLIVMPISLIHNWENEIKKFTPNLKFMKYVGANRVKDFGIFENYDVILTTYGLIRNDIDILSGYPFTYVILDESQYIKNPDSKIYKAVNKLTADHRIVLTGTPIENSLTDLWAQLNFLNTGLLGNLSHFKREFVAPIEKQNDKIKEEKLLTLIKPFVLRRTKQEVAKELPDKMEQVIYCDMTLDQDKIYEEEKSIIRNYLMESFEEKDKKPAFVVLKGLHKLRQIANHPVMIDPDYLSDSGKFEEIIRNMESIIAEKHKVLIFSSFVKHLNILAKHLDDNSHEYSMLTGRTRDKESTINAFQDSETNNIFLIQIKAGGVGLNLTAADYVFILDPWWNPAVEEQAINRTHRIGQEKHVFIYRFISVGTVEEKIQLLKERKSELASTFINKNQALGKMSVEEMMELFN